MQEALAVRRWYVSQQGGTPRQQGGAAGQAPRAAHDQDASAEAWAAAPDDKLRLKLKDIKCVCICTCRGRSPTAGRLCRLHLSSA